MAPPKLTKNARRVRAMIAQEAARIMHEESVHDYCQAKDKACVRLNIGADGPLPRNEEVQLALETYLRVFKAETQTLHMQQLRSVAREAMQFLSVFQPHLVGSVLNGTADVHSTVHLHVFADTVEEVTLFLLEKQIPHEISADWVRYTNHDQQQVPVVRFVAGGTPIELAVFPQNALRQPPLSVVDGKVQKRVNLAGLQSILDSNADS